MCLGCRLQLSRLDIEIFGLYIACCAIELNLAPTVGGGENLYLRSRIEREDGIGVFLRLVPKANGNLHIACAACGLRLRTAGICRLTVLYGGVVQFIAHINILGLYIACLAIELNLVPAVALGVDPDFIALVN